MLKWDKEFNLYHCGDNVFKECKYFTLQMNNILRYCPDLQLSRDRYIAKDSYEVFFTLKKQSSQATATNGK